MCVKERFEGWKTGWNAKMPTKTSEGWQNGGKAAGKKMGNECQREVGKSIESNASVGCSNKEATSYATGEGAWVTEGWFLLLADEYPDCALLPVMRWTNRTGRRGYKYRCTSDFVFPHPQDQCVMLMEGTNVEAGTSPISQTSEFALDVPAQSRFRRQARGHEYEVPRRASHSSNVVLG